MCPINAKLHSRSLIHVAATKNTGIAVLAGRCSTFQRRNIPTLFGILWMRFPLTSPERGTPGWGNADEAKRQGGGFPSTEAGSIPAVRSGLQQQPCHLHPPDARRSTCRIHSSVGVLHNMGDWAGSPLVRPTARHIITAASFLPMSEGRSAEKKPKPFPTPRRKYVTCTKQSSDHRQPGKRA